MSFILQKAIVVQTSRMRGLLFTMLAATSVVVLGATPESAMARENEQSEATGSNSKAQCRIVRQMTESLPIRKKDKDRVRRILM